MAIADGADCLSKLAVLRNQEALFGPVAYHPTAWRAVEAVAAVELAGIDTARATAPGADMGRRRRAEHGHLGL